MYQNRPESDVPCVLMECDKDVTEEIIKLFKKYKIRKKVGVIF
jgi:hypothetical protein